MFYHLEFYQTYFVLNINYPHTVQKQLPATPSLIYYS